MNDEQFKQLMKKLEDIEREMKKPNGLWQGMFQPPLSAPQYPYDGLPPSWRPIATD